MSPPSITRRARRRVPQVMRDECAIRRPDDLGPLDTGTGEYTPIPGEQVYAGICHVFTYEPFETPHEVADHQHAVQRYFVDIPIDVVGVQVEDVVVITASLLDPAGQVGRTFRIAGLNRMTLSWRQRLLIDEVVD